MADRYGRYNSRYMDGNAARAIDAAPVRRHVDPERTPERRTRTQEAPARKKVSFFSVAFTLVAVVGILYLALSYIMVQSDITMAKKDIAKLESEISQMERNNKEAYESIDASVDLDEVYDIATKRLGMVHATEAQVFTYDDSLSDRVVQYANIPTR